MGKEIEPLLKERGHELIGPFGKGELQKEHLQKADVAIEFTKPEAAFNNLKSCIEANVPVVSGTTGWLERYTEIEALATEKKIGFLYASNFSLGVNLFFELNRKLASLMANQEAYTASMEEIHHTEKLDAPSGTAISLAEQIIREQEHLKHWSLANEETTEDDALPIEAKRIAGVPGTHHIKYSSPIDDIEIKHTAHNRKGFALGAVIAAEYVAQQKGVCSMKDVLNL
jgi:4-hydroxy-tetrahydrodipicolinate reductase